MDWLRLIGIPIILGGLALRLRTTFVVVVAGVATGMAGGIPLFSGDGREGIVEMLGRAFTENRLMTLFVLTLPAIGLAERYGLQQQSVRLIHRFRAATAGRLEIVYQLFRVLHGILGVRVNGHAVFVRPLVFPMALGAVTQDGMPSEATTEKIKAASAAAENYGNFYGQNLSPVQAGILLVYGVLAGLGYPVSLWRLVLFALPVATLSVILGAVQFLLLDRSLRRRRE